MSGRTVRDVLADWLWEDYGSHEAANRVGAAMAQDLGLDRDMPFDPARQRCVVVDVCTTCQGSGEATGMDSLYLRPGVCRACEGRGVRWTA